MKNKKSQKNIFLENEGDNWFERNKNISKKDLPKDMNLCYNKHKSLLDIANKINKLMNKPYENVVVQQSGYYTEYTGNGEMLDTLGLELDGLDKGLERCINV